MSLVNVTSPVCGFVCDRAVIGTASTSTGANSAIPILRFPPMFLAATIARLLVRLAIHCRSAAKDGCQRMHISADVRSPVWIDVLLLCFCAFVAPTSATQTGPPKDPAATRTAELVELVKLDPTIKLDIRYAGSNNFVGKPLYKEARAFLQRPAAEALAAAHRELAAHGYGLLIHDGYRPW